MKRIYSTAKELRSEARGRLKNRWGIAIFAFLIALALGAVGGTLSFRVTENISYVTRNTVTNNEYVETVPSLDTEAADGAELVDDFAYDGEIDMGDEDHRAYIQDAVNYLILVMLLVLIVVVVISYCSLYTIFVAAPLQMGYMRFNLDLFKTRKEVSVNRLLYGFQNKYSRSVGAGFLMGLIYVGVALRFMLIPIALIIVSWIWMSDLVTFLCLISFFVGVFAWGIANIKVALRYSMCYYLLADHPEMTAREALKASKEMMKGHKWRLFCLRLSFLGWIFLSVLSCGIGLLWVGPYIQAAETAFYRELVNGGKKQSFLARLFGSV